MPESVLKLPRVRALPVDDGTYFQHVVEERGAEFAENLALVSTADGFRILNFNEGENSQSLIEYLTDVVASAIPDDVDAAAFRAVSGLPDNNWATNHHGQGYFSRMGEAGRPDLQGRVDDFAGRVLPTYQEHINRWRGGEQTGGQLRLFATEADIIRPEARVDVAEARAAAEPLVAAMEGVEITLHDTEATLPEQHQAEIAERGAVGRVRGYVDPETGEIHVVLGNFRNAAEVQQTILEEAVGHVGVLQVLGDRAGDTFVRHHGPNMVHD